MSLFSEFSPRIRSLSLPPKITLTPRTGIEASSYVQSLSSLSSLLIPPLPLNRLVVQFNRTLHLKEWSPYLRFFNPEVLTLKGSPTVPDSSTTRSKLSTFVVSKEDLSFTLGWTCLRAFWGYNDRSIPVLEESDGKEFGLGECLRRGGGSLVFDLVTPLVNEAKEEEAVEEEDLASHISGMAPLKSKEGPHLRVTVAEGDGEGEDSEESPV